MSGALLRLALDMAGRYEAAKRARAALDYDDLILRVKQLLAGDHAAAWVLYKLDGGIEHILVDEAQDTNPDQWDIVRALTGEFFSGEGAAVRERTVFAVGDAKQSIFSFQRADPRKLAEMRTHFDEAAQRARRRFGSVGLTASFRSTEAVLAAVDAVFAAGLPANEGVGEEGEINHLATRSGQPGLVELWPLCRPQGDADDMLPARRMARLVAAHCAQLIGRERLADGRLIDAGDIMVLVRKRNAFVGELIGELKARGIDVAGRDRLSLFDDLGVQDLVALGKAALLPTDDLTLACVLKGPLIGFDEAALFTLAHGRDRDRGRPLRARHVGRGALCAGACRLSTIFARADFLPPFAFYARLLGAEGARRALLERLGPDALDPIDEFLAQALSWSTAGHGSLQGFLHHIETEGGEIKRDLDGMRRREVRILTVHAAKGLQAPIVYLPDTCSATDDHERVLWVPQGPPLWAFRAAETRVPTIDTLKADLARRQREEHHRLLYVAMTRAGERLYVGGFHGPKTPRGGHWHGLVEAGLRGAGEAFAFDSAAIDADAARPAWTGDGLRLTRGGSSDTPPRTDPPRVRQKLPGWVRGSAPAERVPPRPLMPSRPEEEDAAGEAGRAVLVAGASRRCSRRWPATRAAASAAARCCIGCCSACPTCRRAIGPPSPPLGWRAKRPISMPIFAPAGPGRRWRPWPCPTPRPCSRPARAPRHRWWGWWIRRRAGLRSVGRSTGWRSRKRRSCSPTSRPTARRPSASRTCRASIAASWRSIAPCWPASIPTARCAASCCGPTGRG